MTTGTEPETPTAQSKEFTLTIESHSGRETSITVSLTKNQASDMTYGTATHEGGRMESLREQAQSTVQVNLNLDGLMDSSLILMGRSDTLKIKLPLLLSISPVIQSPQLKFPFVLDSDPFSHKAEDVFDTTPDEEYTPGEYDP